MITATTIPELRAALSALPGPVGIVPTMGYLHEGHISLVRAARQRCASVVASIFVNPTQFGENEDLESYPRNLAHDLSLLENAGADLVWTPETEQIYPDGFQTWVNVDQVTRVLEGAQRPGHFRGVTTVVAILFNVVQPDMAFFGQKDAQQVAVIRQMVRDLQFPIEVVVCPTIREADGLAMSSRNSYLNPDERAAATVLFRALTNAETAFRSGERNPARLRKIMQDTLSEEPLARPQYASCADAQSLRELEGNIETQALLSMAVYVGKTRLIDNIVIG